MKKKRWWVADAESVRSDCDGERDCAEVTERYAVCFHVDVMSHTICGAKLDLLGENVKDPRIF